MSNPDGSSITLKVYGTHSFDRVRLAFTARWGAGILQARDPPGCNCQR